MWNENNTNTPTELVSPRNLVPEIEHARFKSPAFTLGSRFRKEAPPRVIFLLRQKVSKCGKRENWRVLDIVRTRIECLEAH